jgi:tripartite-type tricarboxylate transporter receptor subunit TctC
VPGYAVDPWLGLFVPGKTPPGVMERINVEVRKFLAAPEVKAKFSAQGIEVWTSSPHEFARFLREDYERWGKVIRDAGIKGE